MNLSSKKKSVNIFKRSAFALTLAMVFGTALPSSAAEYSKQSSRGEASSQYDNRKNEFKYQVQELTGLVAQVMNLTVEDFLAKSTVERRQVMRQLKRMQRVCAQQGCDASNEAFASMNIEFDGDVAAAILDGYEALAAQGHSTESVASEVFQVGMMDYRLHSTDYESNESEDSCVDDCAKVFAVQAASALVTYTTALGVCTLTGPGWPFCVASASLAYGMALEGANTRLEKCKDDCDELYGEGGSSDNSYCEDDSDCDSGEWCDKGVVFGIGVNECKPKKSVGAACSRDGVCLSGCCKFYWWRWECRPSSKC